MRILLVADDPMIWRCATGCCRASTAWLILLACLNLAGGLVGCGGPPSEPAEIRVGLLVDSNREPPVAAARLAIRAVNEAGGIEVGGRPHQVVLVVENTQDTPEGASGAALKLINQQAVAALVGPGHSRTAIPAAEVANHARIPMISSGSTHPRTTAGKDCVFRVAFLDSFQGRVMARFAIDDLGATSASVLYDVASAYSRNVAAVFQRVFAAAGGRVVASESYTTGDQDFRDQLLRIRDGKPQVLFLPNFRDDVVAQTSQARRLGIDAAFLGSDSWTPPALTWQPELEGAFLSLHWHLDVGHANAGARAFIAAYRRAHDQDPTNIAALTYDAMNLLLAAIRSSGKGDPEAIRRALSRLEHFPGVTGEITYRGTGGDPPKQAVIAQLREGKVHFYRLVAPETAK